MVDMHEPICTTAESLANEMMELQAEDAYADGNRTNDYRERSPLTRACEICSRIPKSRARAHFPEDLIDCFSRADRAAVATVSKMFTSGINVHKVARIAGAKRMSAS